MRWGTVIATAVLCAVLAWLAWPYGAAVALYGALKRGDQTDLADRIDWASLRSGLHDDLNAAMLASMAGQQPSDPMATGLAALLGPAIVDRVVDAYVTPAGLAMMMTGARPTDAAAPTATGAQPATMPDHPLNLHDVRYAFFTGPTTFRIDLEARDGSRVVTLLFNWAGRWRLTRLFLPADLFKDQPTT